MNALRESLLTDKQPTLIEILFVLAFLTGGGAERKELRFRATVRIIAESSRSFLIKNSFAASLNPIVFQVVV